jgi:hypothetical protein
MTKRIIWATVKSYKVQAPDYFEATNLEHLRQQLQTLADSYIPDPDNFIPPLGDLEFRYELDENEEPDIIHAYFTDKNLSRARFIRLRRE